MKRIYVTVGVLTVLFILTLGWWMRGTSPANSSDNTPKIFIVEQGEGVRSIARNLKDQGLIKDPTAFFLLTKKTGLDSKIQAGSFRLNPSMTAHELAQALTVGTEDVWITIPEGQRAGEIADTLEKLMPNYDSTWETVLEENEGYLFPDTYLLPKDAGVDAVVKIMKDNFVSKYSTLDTSKVSLTENEIITLASLIEREARHAQDRPMVSSVIHNRLDIGMKLDIDATLQYIKGYDSVTKRWWPNNITNEDKQSSSLYNTYGRAGLPPAPIANPGLSSLEAAVNPDDTPYFYYITDKNGVNRYAKTLDEHEENISTYGL